MVARRSCSRFANCATRRTATHWSPSPIFFDTRDRVVVRFEWRRRTRGPDVNVEMTCVNTVREGKITEFAYFWAHADALKAVGLEE